MRETPVTAGCARAIAAGTKTMLRRVAADPALPCPLGEPGESLWVRAHGDDDVQWQLVRIASIRVERLQEIRDDDLDAEGGFWRGHAGSASSPREAFGRWWDSVHARPGTKWNDDPHVWVVAFERPPQPSLSRVLDLSADERDEVRALSLAVYPPEEWADWPGRRIEWAEPEWCVRIRGEGGALVSFTGVVLRDGIAGGTPVRIGGVGSIKTHPDARGRGHARAGIETALHFFRERDASFALLVCEPHLVPYYASLGWAEFSGRLRVIQHGESAAFTFNRVMTHPVHAPAPVDGTIDLRGAPW